MQARHFQYPSWCHRTYRKFFRATWSSKTLEKSLFSRIFKTHFAGSGSTKIEKRAMVCVSSDRNRLVHRGTIPFTSADSCDPREDFKHSWRCMQPPQKFSCTLQSKASHLQKHIFFWHQLSNFMISHQNHAKSWKNCHHNVFSSIKNVSCTFLTHHNIFWKA